MAAAVSAAVTLDRLPDELVVGAGAILAIRGRIARGACVRHVDVAVDGEPQRFADLDEGLLLPVAVDGRRAGRSVDVRVSAATADGDVLVAEQRIALRAGFGVGERIDTPIAIALATYEPDERLFARQVASLRAQTRSDFTCIVNDDGSSDAALARIRRVCDGDARFRVFSSARNRGFYANFEAALARIPPTVPYVALCDQDDAWHPTKLAETIAALEREPSAQLAYCDMRIVDEDGRARAATSWTERRTTHAALDTLMFVNSVTGAASVMRGALLRRALPFPPAHGRAFHDHWLACVARAVGPIAFVDRALYDYTQHRNNVIGLSSFRRRSPLGVLLRDARDAVELLFPSKLKRNAAAMRAHYDEEFQRLSLIAATLRLRCGDAVVDPATLALFDGRWSDVARLAVARHARVLLRGDTTDNAEVRLGMSLFVHKLAAASRRRTPC